MQMFATHDFKRIRKSQKQDFHWSLKFIREISTILLEFPLVQFVLQATIIMLTRGLKNFTKVEIKLTINNNKVEMILKVAIELDKKSRWANQTEKPHVKIHVS